MSYLPLKIYEYNNHGGSASEYERRYCCDDAKHIDINIGPNRAFFVETREIRKQALDLYKKDKKLAKLFCSLPVDAMAQYMIKSLVDEIQITNSIEGVHSTKQEIRAAYDNKGVRFRGIVDKYRLLMSGKKTALTSCKDMRSLYDDLVLPEVLEESPKDRPDGKVFRKERVRIYGHNLEPIHEGVYPEEEIISTMTAALEYLNNEEEELLYRVSVFHYLLGYIHPFYNGNGRLNRFISSYMLTGAFEPLLGYRLSYAVKDNQSKYIRAFNECNDEDNRGELTMFVEMFLNILTESMDSLIEDLELKKYAWNRYYGAIPLLPFGSDKYYPTVYRELILHELFAPEGIGMSELQETTDISAPTLRKLLKSINEAGLLKIDKAGKRLVYGIDLKKTDGSISQ